MPLTRRNLLLSALMTFPIAGCITPHPPLAAIPVGFKVLALGDSLTFGTGVAPHNSYPSVLAQITGWKVINAGIPGETSRLTRKRLPQVLKQHNPGLVLTCIGINDFMSGQPLDEVKHNVQDICEYIADQRIQQMLISVPLMRPDAPDTRTLQDAPLYQEIAQQLDIPLQKNALLHMIASPQLRSDFVHGNARGYAQFAYEIALSLFQVGLLNRLPTQPG